MAVLNTIQFRLKSVHYMQQVFLWAHPSPQCKRYLNRCNRFPFLPGSLGDRPTDRPTDHAVAWTRARSRTCHCQTAQSIMFWSKQRHSSIRRCFKWLTSDITVDVLLEHTPHFIVRGIWVRAIGWPQQFCEMKSGVLQDKNSMVSPAR